MTGPVSATVSFAGIRMASRSRARLWMRCWGVCSRGRRSRRRRRRLRLNSSREVQVEAAAAAEEEEGVDRTAAMRAAPTFGSSSSRSSVSALEEEVPAAESTVPTMVTIGRRERVGRPDERKNGHAWFLDSSRTISLLGSLSRSPMPLPMFVPLFCSLLLPDPVSTPCLLSSLSNQLPPLPVPLASFFLVFYENQTLDATNNRVLFALFVFSTSSFSSAFLSFSLCSEAVYISPLCLRTSLLSAPNGTS